MELTLVLTRDCNLACAYCYAGSKRAVAMPIALAERAISWGVDRAAATGHPLLLGYFGGEPLLAWDAIVHLHPCARDLATRRGVALRGTLTTNATLLTAERMAWLDAHGIVVGVSIDGPPAIHDQRRPLRGGGPSSSRVLAGLATAIARQPLCQTISVIGPGNVRDLAATVDFLLGQGVRVIGLGIDHTATWELDDLDAYRRQLEAVGDRFLAELAAGRDLWIDAIDGKIVSRVKDGLAACDRCDAGGRELALAPSGRWYPCERLVGDDGPREAAWVIGDAAATADGGPDPALVAAFHRRHAPVPSDCQACSHRPRCQNGCACSNIMATGEPAQPGGVLCATEQAAIAVADRVGAALFAAGNPRFLRKHYRLDPTPAGAPPLRP